MHDTKAGTNPGSGIAPPTGTVADLTGAAVASTSPASEVVAFIDLGTNSVRLLLVRILTDHAVQTITEQKEMVRLGENEFGTKMLQPDAMARAIAVCREFTELARFHDATTIVAVATSATREATNQADFLQRMADEAGLEMRVISGREEARLTYLGVVSGLHVGEQQALFIDIGGGSTEIVRGDQYDYTFLDSLTLGAIRLTNEFFTPEELETPVSDARWKELRRKVRHTVSHTAYHLRSLPVTLAFGSSGTIVNLAVIAARTAAVPPPTEDVLLLDDLRRVAQTLRSLPLDERRRVPGINPPRADIIVAGAAIILVLMEEFGLEQIQATPQRGLREGLLEDYLRRTGQAHLVLDMNVRLRSVLQLARACRVDEEHARTVATLALQLFDSSGEAGLHGFGPEERELLEYAGLLHDIGAFLSYRNHHRHGYYLIANSDLLGFDQREIATLAAITLFHRKTVPSDKQPEFAELGKKAKALALLLSLLVRLAESLDRSHTGAVERVTLRPQGDDAVLLELYATRDCRLELWGLRDKAKAVERTLGRRFEVAVIRPEGADDTLDDDTDLES
jgi:exopolyphosphatase / guanosine-5'-triphosphate,3'-diphosphate pyrophosphatase